MANTIGNTAFREKWFKAGMQQVLHQSLVAEKICDVDTSDSRVIKNPYASRPTVTVQALAGTYTPATFTLTDDNLTVTDEFIVAEQIFGFEDILSNYDLYADRMQNMMFAVKQNIDKFVLNSVLKSATGTYTTPAGGFTTTANVNTIIGNLAALVSGYDEARAGFALVIENTDLAGIIPAQMANGFSYADAALNNGFLTSYGGVEIYVVRTGTFVSATIGTQTFTNSGRRLFMVKGVATYAQPRQVSYEEKAVSGKTGKEVVVSGLIGVKLWTQNAGLAVNITLA